MARCRPGTQLFPWLRWVPALRRTAKGRCTASGTPETLGFPAIPTISCEIIGCIPQVLGRDRPMWYLASASFDRHT